jgi:hypothetical protein
MSNRTIQLDDQLYIYLQSVAVREPEILAKLRAERLAYQRTVLQNKRSHSRVNASYF